MGRKVVMALAGAAVLAIGGGALARAAAQVHEVRLLLPDGSVERIRYTGDVAPRVALVPVAAPMIDADPFGDAGFGFAAFDRMAAAMHAQAATMLRQASLLAAQPQGAAAMAPGTVSYSFVAMSGDGRTCRQSVRVTALAAGQAPEVVRQSSGDCQPGGHAVAPAVRPAAPAMPPLVPVSAPGTAKPAVKTTRT